MIIKDNSAERNIWLVDTASVCVEGKIIAPNQHSKTRCMQYNIYTLKSDECVDTFIQHNNTKTMQPYCEMDYCTHCIKCGQITLIACYCENNSSLGLGKSYCHNCSIRYSLSEKRWVCAKLVRSDKDSMAYVCGKPVDAETQNPCCDDHSTEELVFESQETHTKPYKRDVTLCIKKGNNK